MEENKKIKSDGGSSDYYKVDVPQHILERLIKSRNNNQRIYIEVGEIIDMMLGDRFTYGNILKALKRIFEVEEGRGKVGTDIKYDANKIRWFLGEIEKKNGV